MSVNLFWQCWSRISILNAFVEFGQSQSGCRVRTQSGAEGMVINNTPDTSINNFWRIRSFSPVRALGNVQPAANRANS